MNTSSLQVAALVVSFSVVGCSSGVAVRAQRQAAAPAPAGVAGVHAVRIPLRSQDARQVSGVLRDVLDVPRSPEVRAILDEPESNAIVVVGTDAGIAAVRRMLSPALIGEESDAGVDVLALAHARAGRLAHAVERVAPGDVRVVVDEATNSLVVAGPAESRAQVLRLARVLDAPGG